MVFNSVVFLFCFLPLSLLLYYLVPGRAKNAVLLAESLIFYCWTGVAFLPLIAVLIVLLFHTSSCWSWAVPCVCPILCTAADEYAKNLRAPVGCPVHGGFGVFYYK